MRLRHRYLLAAPFVAILVVTVVGGLVNSTTARARVVDDFTDQVVKGATITFGKRSATTGANGEYTLPDVPRTSSLQIDAPGYLRTSAPTTDSADVRMKPLSLTVYVYDASKTQNDRLKNAESRDPKDPTKVVATANDSGQIVITPHPGKDADVYLCAPGFQPKTVQAQGVLMQVGLEPGGSGCPPIPTPTPTATPASSASPSTAPTPAPSPSGTP